VSALGADVQAELVQLFPDLKPPRTARPVLSVREAEVLRQEALA
jgi:hypothetical protein